MKDGKFVILYVDDDPDMLETIGAVVQAAGYAFESAPTAELGLRKYKEVQPDFVMIDLMMEEVDAGRGLAKELKMLGNKAPVYMLTSVGDQLNAMSDAASIGVDGIFQKPIDFNFLKKTLKTRLG